MDKDVYIGAIMIAALGLLVYQRSREPDSLPKSSIAQPAYQGYQIHQPYPSSPTYLHTPQYSTQTFAGYRCTVDCSGHQAGYDWAEEHDIHDPEECGGNSQSFIEGCRSYVKEQYGLE